MTHGSQWMHHVISLAYIIFSWLIIGTPREDFNQVVLLYSVLFGCYLILLHLRDASYRYILNVAIITQVGAIILAPNLSNDIYRFLWDGSVTWMGENPMNSTPRELMRIGTFKNSVYLNSLFRQMSELSQGTPTCYPTVNQFYFVAATAFSKEIWINTIVLKIMIAVTQGFGIVYFVRLLNEFSLKNHRVFILILNPLWMVETIGNTHFEGVMISFLIIGFYFLVKQKWVLAAVFIGIAIHVKLIPIVLLPFFFRYLGWKNSALLYWLVLMVVISLGLIYLNPGNIKNFIESITLYFRAFEFNSFIYYHYLHHGYDVLGWYPVRTYGYKLSRLSLFLLMSVAFYGGFHDFKSMMKRMMFGILIYLLLSTTIHPWYILTLLVLSVFTEYSFGIIWSFVIILSYAAYGPYSDATVREFVTLEYLVLLAAILLELIRRKPIIPIMHFQDLRDLRSGTGS